MAVEKIDKNKDAWLDPNMEIRTVQYLYRDLAAGNIAGVISQPQIVRYFEEQNPELVVKKVYAFKNDPQALTVTIKMQVTKKKSAAIEILDEFATQRDHEYFKSQVEKAPIPEPITDPARLLNAGQTESIIKAADHDLIDSKNARIAELEGHLKRIVENPTGLPEKTTIGTDSFPMVWVPKEAALTEYAVRDRKIAELEKENATLKSAIEKFGNSDEFDWNVLGRIELLEREKESLEMENKDLREALHDGSR